MKFNIQIIFFKWLALCFAILVSTGSNQAFAQVKVSMSQESYYQGDLITLKIESDKNQKAEPDLSVLENNFTIKVTSANSQISIINGNRSYKKIWNIELQANKAGSFTIPKIKVGNESTEEISVNIRETTT